MIERGVDIVLVHAVIKGRPLSLSEAPFTVDLVDRLIDHIIGQYLTFVVTNYSSDVLFESVSELGWCPVTFVEPFGVLNVPDKDVIPVFLSVILRDLQIFVALFVA